MQDVNTHTYTLNIIVQLKMTQEHAISSAAAELIKQNSLKPHLCLLLNSPHSKDATFTVPLPPSDPGVGSTPRTAPGLL